MILPIVVYGDPVLRKMGEDIDKDYEGLDALIKNMFDTMYNANGVGLAAPNRGWWLCRVRSYPQPPYYPQPTHRTAPKQGAKTIRGQKPKALKAPCLGGWG